ncbi:hypothetical protein [Williamsia sterculiae]|uniref:Lipoprotein n=1 Tax=Williamsia sterculiae TaxID=1344003 RepID=A0A1N7FCT8_9NOCA|nr:hypothetical protein [Williamsia sterculiae]SIR98124.1 hypothetical protein SAMN05445060_1938 [Williamsia sterculiae]
MALSTGRRLAVLLMVLIAPVALLAGCKGSSKSSSSAASNTTAAASASGSQAASSDCPTENTKSFAKTKFVAHAGLGFGAFHRYLYKPYKAGTFKKGADGRVTAFVKGGVAALFIKREIRLASEDVKANPTLCKAIAAPLAKIGDSVQGAVDKAKSGDDSGLEDVNSAIGSVSSQSNKDGVDIKEDENADISKNPS